MRQLNYSHLRYFHMVARERSVTRAAQLLYVTPQTISGQLKLLDIAVGSPLFERSGRRLVLTEMGHLVYQYAETIFNAGAELAVAISGRSVAAPAVLNVGVSQSIPKLIAQRMIQPALHLETPLRIVCVERSLEELLGELAVHSLDVVLSDRPIPEGLNVRAYSHSLGECGTSWFVATTVPRKRQSLAETLGNACLLLPRGGSVLRRQIDAWLEASNVRVRIAFEFDDSALLKVFGMEGAGVFPGPTAIEKEICAMYRVRVVGRTAEIRERFYAISPERRLRHPAVVAISDAARAHLFGVSGKQNLRPVGQRKAAQPLGNVRR